MTDYFEFAAADARARFGQPEPESDLSEDMEPRTDIGVEDESGDTPAVLMARCTGSPQCGITKCQHYGDKPHAFDLNGGCKGGCFQGGECKPELAEVVK